MSSSLLLLLLELCSSSAALVGGAEGDFHCESRRGSMSSSLLLEELCELSVNTIGFWWVSGCS